MTLPARLSLIACTCAVLSAPALAIGVVDAGALQKTAPPATTQRPAATRPLPPSSLPAPPPAAQRGTDKTPALIVAAMLLAAFGIRRRLR